jgi:uncharacterized protein
MLKVANIRVPVGADEADLPRRVGLKLGAPAGDFRAFRILRKALDVRDKSRIQHVYTVAVALDDETAALRRADPRQVSAHADEPFHWPDPGAVPLRHRPVVVGAGPAGLLAAHQLALHGYAPLLLERGRAVSDRIPDVKSFDDGGPLDPESNYLFGEGGAGTFSDGKLTCRRTGADTDRVLEILAESKGKPSILYEAKPHLGSNRLPAVVKALRRAIIAAGGEVRFGALVEDLDIADGRIRGVRTATETITADAVVLAIGHSARDTYRMLLRRGVPMSTKPFQMGVRIEQPQANVTRAQHGLGPWNRILGPADYTMKVRAGTVDLFTFCMCAGGFVMPSVSQHGQFCTNGMSRSKHESPYANSGLVVTVDPAALPAQYGGDALAGLRYQEELEGRAYALGGDYRAPVQWAKDFVAQRLSSPPPTSHPRGGTAVNLWEFLPTDLCETLRVGLPAMDDRWRGLFLRDATLAAPETRGSCPIRLDRDPGTLESSGIAGLYPIGEGAGHAGGIVSAAVDGLRAARAIAARFRPA